MANSGASNGNYSQIKRRRRLPLELQCEVFGALPFHYGRQMLLLCRPIATNCVALVRKQKKMFENRWDSVALHEDLTLSKPDGLIVQLIVDGCRSVHAERPFQKNTFGIFYYEVTILEQGINVLIGIATKQMPLQLWVGWDKGTYAYTSNGLLLGHEAEHLHIERRPKFGVDDVIGCGVDLATRQIIYTKNGQRLETDGLHVDFGADLFPCVTLFHAGTKIEANFGPNFKFNIAADGT